MGGKSYFCDYCLCYMKNDINVRKIHNDAVSHKIKKARYMKNYDDPRKIYEEEIRKPPCSHFFKGSCRYDLYCQSSHFTQKQLQQLKKLVDKLNKKKTEQKTVPSTNTTQSINRLLPWNMNRDVIKRRNKYKLKILPPSLRPLNLKKLDKFINKNNNNTWG